MLWPPSTLILQVISNYPCSAYAKRLNDEFSNVPTDRMQSIREQRREQMYPTLDSLEIERVRRFGDARAFPVNRFGPSVMSLPA